MGKDPEDFLTVANGLNEIGYGLINWNLGCPHPQVTRKGRGAGMLPFPDKIEEFLDKVMAGMKSKISIKLRLGMHSSDEILKLIPIFNRYPLEEIIIHPRTGVQMYTGVVDLDAFERCLAVSTQTVVYNGDINSAATFEKLATRFKTINRWMIGRGALKNPFLIEEIKLNNVCDIQEKLKVLFKFHNELYAEYSKVLFGPAHITDRMKGLWYYLGESFHDSHSIKGRIQRTHNKMDYLSLVNRLFDNERKYARDKH
jgi:tRNA-dihydrouridine synthase